jgi:hypothetical protein
MRQLRFRRNPPMVNASPQVAALKSRAMIEIVRTNDLVTISAIESLLRAARINAFVADGHVSALEGSIGAFQRRIMVPRDEEHHARELLTQAGFGAELRP